MKKWSVVALLMVGAIVLGATVLREPIASAASPFQNVIVKNTADDPVPVTSAPPPLWQGTPYVDTQVLLGTGCEAFTTIPAGKVLYIDHATASFNVAPGRGANAAVQIDPLGANPSDFVYIPTHPSGPVHQSFGVYDGYMGSNDIGLPTTTTPEACNFALAADDVRGRIIITGYLVDE